MNIFESKDEKDNYMRKINWFILPVYNIDGYIHSTKIVCMNIFYIHTLNNICYF